MTAVRVLAVIVVVGMTAAIIFGFTSGDLGEEGSEILGLAWGKVTLIDLYLGFAMFGAWIALRESKWSRVLAWWIALVFLGNLTAGVYLAYAAFTSRDVRQLMLGARS